MGLGAWKAWAKRLKRELYALYLATQDPRVPWYAKAITVCVVAYAFSPIDLIPDFIPVLGYLDDLLLVPLGIAIAVRLIPPDVLADCHRRAEAAIARGQAKPKNWIAAGIILGLWLLLAGIVIWLGFRVWKQASAS